MHVLVIVIKKAVWLRNHARDYFCSHFIQGSSFLVFLSFHIIRINSISKQDTEKKQLLLSTFSKEIAAV